MNVAPYSVKFIPTTFYFLSSFSQFLHTLFFFCKDTQICLNTIVLCETFYYEKRFETKENGNVHFV